MISANRIAATDAIAKTDGDTGCHRHPSGKSAKLNRAIALGDIKIVKSVALNDDRLTVYPLSAKKEAIAIAADLCKLLAQSHGIVNGNFFLVNRNHFFLSEIAE